MVRATCFDVMDRRERDHLNKIAPVPIQLNETTSSCSHVTGASHVTDVLIGDYCLVSGEGISGSYVVWSIRIVIDNALHSSVVLYKRYSDIERLRKDLTREFPDEEIPLLPPKDSLSFSRMCNSESWLENRRKGLQWFLTYVLLNPKFQHNPVITEFILS